MRSCLVVFYARFPGTAGAPVAPHITVIVADYCGIGEFIIGRRAFLRCGLTVRPYGAAGCPEFMPHSAQTTLPPAWGVGYDPQRSLSA